MGAAKVQESRGLIDTQPPRGGQSCMDASSSPALPIYGEAELQHTRHIIILGSERRVASIELQQYGVGTQSMRGRAACAAFKIHSSRVHTGCNGGMCNLSCTGTRDFAPEEYRLRAWLFGAFEGVSRAFSFEQFDTPVLESEGLFVRKAGEEITQQLYNFEVGGSACGFRSACSVEPCMDSAAHEVCR